MCVVAEQIVDEAPRDEEVDGRLIALESRSWPKKLRRLTCSSNSSRAMDRN